MNEKTKATLTNPDTWKRGLFMIVFAIISGVAKMIVSLIAIFQFITLLFKGLPNERMIPFGQNLSTYLYQITLFLTFKSNEMPFPFLTFPDGAPESTPNEENIEDIVTNEPTTASDEEYVDAVDEDNKDEAGAKKDTQSEAQAEKEIKDETGAEKDTKDDSLKG